MSSFSVVTVWLCLTITPVRYTANATSATANIFANPLVISRQKFSRLSTSLRGRYFCSISSVSSFLCCPSSAREILSPNMFSIRSSAAVCLSTPSLMYSTLACKAPNSFADTSVLLIIFSNKKATTFCDRNFLCLYYNTS